MVAAYPVVGVKMEKLILSKNQISSTEQGKTISRATSNSSTSSITYNSGSAPIYDVQPTTNLVLDKDTINTILAGPRS